MRKKRTKLGLHQMSDLLDVLDAQHVRRLRDIPEAGSNPAVRS